MIEYDPNTQYYKFLKSGGKPAIAQTRMRWKLPTVSEEHGIVPGKWNTVRQPIYPCVSGLHVTTAEEAYRWTSTELYEVEIDPRVHKVRSNGPLGKKTFEYQSVVGDLNKLVCRRVRLVRHVPEWNQRAEWDFCRTVLRAMRDTIAEREASYGDAIDGYQRYMDSIDYIINAEHLTLKEQEAISSSLLNPQWHNSVALGGVGRNVRLTRWRSLLTAAQRLNGSRIECSPQVVASYQKFLATDNDYRDPAFHPSVTGFIPALLARS